MNQKASSLGLVWTEGRSRAQLHRQALLFAAGLVVVIMAAVVVYTQVIVAGTAATPKNVASVAAETARWNAMANHYLVETLQLESSARANIAGWNGSTRHHGADVFNVQRAADADSARLSAQAAHYLARSEAANAAGTARLSGLAEWYAAQAAQED